MKIFWNDNEAYLAVADSILNTTFVHVVGNKTDVANNTVGQASIMGLLRWIEDNLFTDADVAAIIGELNTLPHTGAVDDLTTIMGYAKQLVTDLRVVDGIVDTILLDTAELQTDWTDGGRLDLLIDAIKAVTDALPDAGALTSLAQDATVAKEATLGVPAGASISADIAALDTKLGVPTVSVGADLASIIALIGTPVTDLVADINGLIGAPVVSITADIAGVKAEVDAIKDILDGDTTNTDKIKREAGRTQIVKIAIGQAANAGLTTIGTVTTKGVMIKSIVLRATAAGQVDLTSAAIKGGGATGETITFIDAATAVKNAIDDVDEQVVFTGNRTLPATGLITVDLQGTGATVVALEVVIEYVAVEDGGYIA